MGAPFETRPVKGYRTPRYPRYGWTIPPAVERHLWSSLPLEKLAVAAASGAFVVASAGCFPTSGIQVAACTQEVHLDEGTARQVLREAFTARGYGITEDFAFSRAPVSFTADGYDATAEVGYDYQTEEERAADFETIAEAAQLATWSQADGPFFLIMDAKTDCQWEYEADDTEARARLRSGLELQIEDFLAALEANGHL